MSTTQHVDVFLIVIIANYSTLTLAGLESDTFHSFESSVRRCMNPEFVLMMLEDYCCFETSEKRAMRSMETGTNVLIVR